jgi:hypothetical protein
MSKKAKRRTSSANSPARSAGRTEDGVVLLEPVGRPRHFTVAQIRHTIRQLRDEHGWRLAPARPAE